LRRQIKQSGAFLAERYGARFQAVDRATDLPRAIESLITLHRARQAAVGETTAFEDESVLAFLRETTPLLQERGWLRLYALVVGERPVAVEYGLAYRGTFYDYQKGFDLEASKWGAGTVLQGLSVQHACGEGMTEFDFLRGDESYKARWAPYVRQTKRLDIVQRSPRTLFFRGRCGLIRGFREARRRVRAMFGSP
jgi:CelD/BcsL family acetyltransferase involved in cellulose biosynthesis